jgi:glycosyltransferase involved in cell wall biosynthesis
MYTPKVSVIVPVYNTELYLRRCLDSVITQTLREIEIICINDCSTDNSLEILKEYESEDQRIKLIDFEQNKGVSIARNTGINAASGEYIGFVDSDDWIDLSFYEILFNLAKKNNVDIAKGALKRVADDKIIYINTNNFILQDKFHFFSRFYTAIYKVEFIKYNKITFPEEIKTCEDPVFSISCIMANPTISVTDMVFYYYLIHPDSKSRKYNYDQIISCKSALEKIQNVLNENVSDQHSYLHVLVNLLNAAVIQRYKYFDKEDPKCKSLVAAVLENFISRFKFVNNLYIKYPEFKTFGENKNIDELVRLWDNRSIVQGFRDKTRSLSHF